MIQDPLGAVTTKAAAPDQESAASQKNLLPANDTAVSAARATENVIDDKSTATEVQLNKVLALLRQGPKTTIELRDHGIMMPAARVFQLKHERGYVIASEMVPLVDANGHRHSKCARYHLLEVAGLAEGVS